MSKNFPTILDVIGQTPLLSLRRFSKEGGAQILCKAEFFNPLGSVKDRIGQAMIEDAEKSGKLKPGMQIIEPTSGNTGIALAFVCAAKGYSLTLTMPETMSLERRTLLLLFGAKLVLTPGPLGMRGAIAKALELCEQSQPKAWMPSQFENPANPMIHESTTAQEIWTATGGDFAAFVSGVGTGGTITGCGRFFKTKNPSIKIYAVEPQESQVIAGGKPSPHKIQGIGAGFISKNFDRSVMDAVVAVSSDQALQTAKEILRSEGIPVGISSGAALHAAREITRYGDYKGKNVVVILPSYTERYLSTALAEESRVAAQALQPQAVNEKILNTLPLGPA